MRSFDLCRSWLFVGGPDARPQTAADSGADVVILELEDFTPPEARPAARAAASSLFAAWRQAGVVVAVRVNPLAEDGREDLEAVMEGAPDVVLLPKVGGAHHIVELAEAVADAEGRYGLEAGRTALVPNVETTGALFLTREIATADRRVVGCLLASEDLTADLQAPRTREGTEIAFARAFFHAACRAAGVLSIDYPYTFADREGLEASCAGAKALGYRAKSAADPSHPAIINAAFTPSSQEVAEAERLVAAFEAARAEGRDRVHLDGHIVEVPSTRNARALLERARAIAQAG